MDKSATYAFRD